MASTSVAVEIQSHFRFNKVRSFAKTSKKKERYAKVIISVCMHLSSYGVYFKWIESVIRDRGKFVVILYNLRRRLRINLLDYVWMPIRDVQAEESKKARRMMSKFVSTAASPPRRKEIDNVMKKARREGTTGQSQYWNKKLLEAEEKDPNRWRHSGYKELYGEKSSSRSKSRSPGGGGKRSLPSKPRQGMLLLFRTGPRSPPLPSSSSSRLRGKSRSRSYSPPRNTSGKSSSSSRPHARGRPHTPPTTKPVSKTSGGRPKSPCSGSGSESVSSCSDESCSVCSPKHGRRKNSVRSRSRSFSVPRSRTSSGPGKLTSKTSSTTIGRKPPTKDRPRLEGTRAIRERSSPPRDPRGPPPSPPRSKNSNSKRKLLTAVKVEGQPKKKKIVRPGSPADSESDESSSSSDGSGTGAPKLTLSERFGKMAQWSVDRRDIDSVKNMRITKDSDSTDFKVVIEGPDEEDIYRAGAPEFGDRRFGAGYFPESMHAAPVGLTAWDDVRVRYKYYKSRGYLRDLTLEDYMKWEEWWYKYQEWLEAERYYEHWANIRARHHKSRRYGAKLS
ncbi:conserved hypothetical protein [Pediculus humanus corporis]|uniref:Uncharacterized protein n=1 Tax=Pediculus humanus subsp. corporis TaxID=121224 RepID=E0VT98_PEDHC|nr:uncharacterized protein Phum_PHUM429690 [Pediculus humanus corporis]EEB16604.1 conserved hypothetical protein [Pediculus humanus corporis]